MRFAIPTASVFTSIASVPYVISLMIFSRVSATRGIVTILIASKDTVSTRWLKARVPQLLSWLPGMVVACRPGQARPLFCMPAVRVAQPGLGQMLPSLYLICIAHIGLHKLLSGWWTGYSNGRATMNELDMVNVCNCGIILSEGSRESFKRNSQFGLACEETPACCQETPYRPGQRRQ